MRRGSARTRQEIATTDTGDVRGVVKTDHVLFQGIPYATPPNGDLRWSAPAPVARWEGVRDAINFSATHQLPFWQTR
ncbi:carboxylesterase family protein [Actinosynnema sp. CA-248983]